MLNGESVIDEGALVYDSVVIPHVVDGDHCDVDDPSSVNAVAGEPKIM